MNNTILNKLALRLAPWALPVALLAIWQGAVVAGWLSTRILPAPSAVITECSVAGTEKAKPSGLAP